MHRRRNKACRFHSALNTASRIAGLLACTCVSMPIAHALESGPVYLSAASPFLRLVGVPPFEIRPPLSARQLAPGISFDLINHADRGTTASEAIELDGESYYLDFTLRYGISDRLTVGLDVPVVRHSGGVLDNAIERWHEIIGLSNTYRDRPPNQLLLTYSRDAGELLSIEESSAGLGDIRLSGFWEMSGNRDGDGPSFGLAGSVEMPTGDADKLRGNGGTDLSLGLYLADLRVLGSENLVLSASGGVTRPGAGDLFDDFRKSAIGYGGVDLTWRAGERWRFSAATYFQTEGFASDLEELGKGSAQLALAARYLFPARTLRLDVAFMEDIVSDGTPDFGLHFSISRYY